MKEDFRTHAAVEPVGTSHRKRRVKLLGGILGIAMLFWLLSLHDAAAMWRAIQTAKVGLIAAAVPLFVVNMLFRAWRWRALLGPRQVVRYWPVFVALMAGYLSNTLLPARAGDLVRVYVLNNEGVSSWSRILGTIVIERVLDMTAVIVVLSAVASFGPMPGWLRSGALLMGAATAIGIVSLMVVSAFGERMTSYAFGRLRRWRWSLADRLEQAWGEFALGIHRIRLLSVQVAFITATAAIWALEMAIVALVARAFAIELGMLDAAVLMLFSLFSSLIPALPGQIGTFEFAMVSGLAYIGHDGAAAVPFALALHLFLLAGSVVLGYLCLFASGLPLLPRQLAARLHGTLTD